MSHLLLEAQHVHKRFSREKGEPVEALQNISLQAKEGEFISLVGPSGCGKTTLMKLLAGLLLPTTGEIIEHGNSNGDHDLRRGVMFQQYNLFPWLTVEQNIEFGLKIAKRSLPERQKIVEHYIEAVGLVGFERAYPKELSGGMQQRVALARTFATNPEVLFMDEPFAALDAQTKRRMQELLLKIWNAEPRTVIFVTHDIEEAIFLSDTIYVMSPHPGRIQEKISIPFSRPRRLDMEFSSEFVDCKKRLQQVIEASA